MDRPAAAGFTWDDLPDLRGSHDLGLNATGVIHSKFHVLDDEIIIEDTMPACYVQDIMDSVAALRTQVGKRRPGGELVGQIPLPIYHMWRKAWEAGPKQQGVIWRAFLTGKLTDGDHSKFCIRKP